MKEEERRHWKKKKKKKQFWARDMIFIISEISDRNIIPEISLVSLVLPFFKRPICDIGSGAEPQKKSSQKKRTFLYLLQNTNRIGHTLRRVSGGKRRKRERNAHVFLSSSQREKESFFLSCHHRLSKKRFEQRWLFNVIPTVCLFCCWDSLKRRERVYESFSSWVHRKTTTETTTTRR